VNGYNEVQRLLTFNQVGGLPAPAPFANVSAKKYDGNYTGGYAPPNNFIYFNNPSDLTVPPRRYGMVQKNPGIALDYTQMVGAPMRASLPNPTADLSYPIFGDDVRAMPAGVSPLLGQDLSLQGADLLLTDVLSFEVRVLTLNSSSRVATLPNPARP